MRPGSISLQIVTKLGTKEMIPNLTFFFTFYLDQIKTNLLKFFFTAIIIEREEILPTAFQDEGTVPFVL